MPLTARTLLQWTTSHLGTTYRASRRTKTQRWQLWGFAYSLACLLIFDRMVVGCCLPDCSNTSHVYKKTGSNDPCGSNAVLSSVEFCDCLDKFDNDEKRKRFLESYHLKFCDILPFWKELAVFKNKCREKLNKIVEADCAVSHDNSKFEAIVSRIDCRQRYSVRWTCLDCKIAYKEFLCTSKVLPLMLSENKKACTLASCTKVLQRCPYFLPNSESQWSGQSVFECDLDKEDAQHCITASSSKDSNSQTIHQNTNGS